MSICLGWFGVRDTPASRVIDELRHACAIASREDVPEKFDVFEPSGTWSVVILSGSDSQYTVPAPAAPLWAQALSLRLGTPTVSFFLLEGGWSYAVFDNGHEVVAQEHYTLPIPEIYGDRQRGAEVLGISPAVFEEYETAFAEGRETPFPGDEFAPTDEWGHTDFARRFGLLYPDDRSGGTVYAPSSEDVERAGSEWQGLPERLELPDSPPHAEAKGEEIDFDNFPSGDDPF